MKQEPIDFSGYQRTHNNSIDLVTQAAGYARTSGRPVRAFILKPASYDLFKAGVEVLMKKRLEPQAVLTFEGIEVKRGGRAQFESLVVDWYAIPVNPKTDN